MNKNRAHGSVSSRFTRGNGSEFLAMRLIVAHGKVLLTFKGVLELDGTFSACYT